MNEKPLRIVVFGYHTIGYRCLKELLDRGEEVCAVVTHQDDPHEHVWFESVVELAQAAGVPVLSPNTPNTPAIDLHITTLQPDLSCRSITGVSCARHCWPSPPGGHQSPWLPVAEVPRARAGQLGSGQR